jgi:hypothetical protein
MESEYRTWLDRVMLGYLLIGVATLLAGWLQLMYIASRNDTRLGSGLQVLGWIMVFQGLLFIAYRATVGKTSAPKQPVDRAKPAGESGLEDIRQQVAAPGMGLIMAGIFGFLSDAIFVLGFAALFLTKLTPSTALSGPSDLVGLTAFPILAQVPMSDATISLVAYLILIAILQIPAAILMILGGRKMRRLETYGLAVTAAVCALLPLGPSWIISLPIGIWALFVLAGPEVREAFKTKRRGSTASSSPPPPAPVAAPEPAEKPRAVDEWTMVSVRQQLFWPGCGLALGGALSIVSVVVGGCIVLPIMMFFTRVAPSSGDPDAAVWATIFVILGVVLALVQIPWALVVMFGGLKMMRVESYKMAWLGAALALLPLNVAAIVTMPLGVWALVVLSSREVQEAFRQKALPHQR